MSNPLHFHIRGVDTLMFRDGRPFNQSDAGASEAVSVFPPFPPTVVGAVRAALWKSLGGKWPTDNSLGNGTNWQHDSVLGSLRFCAPLLVRGDALCFPVPLHIVTANRRGKGAEICRLSPGPALHCDFGTIRLPGADAGLEGIKAIDDRWVTAGGMARILAGGVPTDDELLPRERLWRNEPRVGIGVSAKTRTTTDGQLYMASHVRMVDDVSLYVRLEGYDNASPEKVLQPLAGEHRMAFIELGREIGLPGPPEKIDGGRYCAIQLSPMVLDAMPKTGDTLPGLPGKLISACLGKPVSIGGWDSVGPTKAIPLRQAIPAGSVWFFEGDDGTALNSHGACIGTGAAWGFGQILIGKW